MNDEFAPTPSTDLVPITTQRTGLPVPLSDRMSGQRLDYWASWPIESQVDRANVYNSKNSECGKLEDHMDKVILVRGVVAHLVELEDPRTHELTEVVRCILFRADGLPLACCSSGVQESVRDLVSNFGQGPWEPPLPLIPHRVKTRAGFTTFKLSLDPSAMPATAPEETMVKTSGKRK